MRNINKFQLCINKRPTQTNRFIINDNPPEQKGAAFNSTIYRRLNIPLPIYNFFKELNYFQWVQNGLDNILNKKKSH